MSHGYGKGCIKWDPSAPRRRKPMLAFVFIAELIFAIAKVLSSLAGIQMTVMPILWVLTIAGLVVMRYARLTKNVGFQAWVIIIASLVVASFVGGEL